VLGAVLERALDVLTQSPVHRDQPLARPIADRLVAGPCGGVLLPFM
jgi:hypothetical protein